MDSRNLNLSLQDHTVSILPNELSSQCHQLYFWRSYFMYYSCLKIISSPILDLWTWCLSAVNHLFLFILRISIFVLKYPYDLTLFFYDNLLLTTVMIPFLLDNINIYIISKSGSDFVFLFFVVLWVCYEHVMNSLLLKTWNFWFLNAWKSSLSDFSKFVMQTCAIVWGYFVLVSIMVIVKRTGGFLRFRLSLS